MPSLHGCVPKGAHHRLRSLVGNVGINTLASGIQAKLVSCSIVVVHTHTHGLTTIGILETMMMAILLAVTLPRSSLVELAKLQNCALLDVAQ